jgi:hypothetical protein
LPSLNSPPAKTPSGRDPELTVTPVEQVHPWEPRDSYSTVDMDEAFKALLAAAYVRSSSAPILIDDVISAIDIKDFTGDELGAIEGEKRRGLADIIDADQTSRRRLALRLVEELIELRNA